MTTDYYLIKCGRARDVNGYPIKVTGDGRVVDMTNQLNVKKIYQTEHSALYCGDFEATRDSGLRSLARELDKQEDLFLIQLELNSNRIKMLHCGDENNFLEKVSKEKDLEQKLGAESSRMMLLWIS